MAAIKRLIVGRRRSEGSGDFVELTNLNSFGSHTPSTVISGESSLPGQVMDIISQEDWIGDPQRKARVNVFIVRSALLACVASILLGYDIGVMSGALVFLRSEFSLVTWEQEAVVSGLNFAALGGSLLGGWLSDNLGRRKTVGGAAVLFCVGNAALAGSWDFLSCLVGRVITGLGVGIGLMIAPLYAAELSPPSLRGRLVTLSETMINVGLLAGFVSSFALAGLPQSYNWRLMLGIGAIPSLGLLAGACVLEESPRWLWEQGRLAESARVMARACATPAELTQSLEGLQREAAAAAANDTAAAAAAVLAAGEGGSLGGCSGGGGAGCCGCGWLCAALCGGDGDGPRAVRSALRVGVGMAFFQQATGIEAAMYYSPDAFRAAGITSARLLLGVNVGIGACKLCLTLLASVAMDRWGRRPMLYVSSVGMAASQLLLAASFRAPHWLLPPWTAVLAQLLFVSFFALGWGPGCWLLISEVFPTPIRGRGMALSTTVNRLVSSAISALFLTLVHALSPTGVYLAFAAASLLTLPFLRYAVPETKGLALEGISATAAATAVAAADDEGHPMPAGGEAAAVGGIATEGDSGTASSIYSTVSQDEGKTLLLRP